MKHEILGDIKLADCRPFDATAEVRFGSRDISISLSRDDQTLETTIELAALVVARLVELDIRAKEIAVTDLSPTYNSGWNEYDEVQEDGSLKSISNPKLSKEEFGAKLSLNAVTITGDRMIEFFYNDEGMFWGHIIVVNSLNGIDLSKAHAELFG